MKLNAQTVATLISIILLPLHVAGDIALGLDRGGSGVVYILMPVLFVVACGIFLLPERPLGHILMFIGGLAALAMPIIHRNNGFTPKIGSAPGGVIFIWTLIALGIAGALAMILSVRGLMTARSRSS